MGPNGIWIVLALITGLCILGVHVALSFAIAAAIGLYFSLGGWESMLSLLQQTAMSGIRDYNLTVIPMFTVMGMLIAYCGAASDLFNIANRALRGIPARLAVATIAGNAVFAAVTGVGVAAAAAFSQVAYPAMRRLSYSRSFATGCIAGSSVLGLLIPPSVLMVIWAVLTEQSVGKLFAAGVLPGILLAMFYAIYCMAHAKLDPRVAPDSAEAAAASRRPEGREARRRETVGWLGVVILIAITLGTIWLGVATPTEGAALGMLGSVVLAALKGMGPRRQFECVLESGMTVTPIMLLILGAMMYSKLLALEGVPDTVRSLMEGMSLGPGGSFLFMVLTWMVLGCLLDSISIMLLTVPVFWPIAAAFGMDPIVFALIGILIIEAGVLTPPFGLGVFVVKAAVPDPQVRLAEIFYGSAPYWLAILLVAAFVYWFPQLVLWMPSKL